MRGGRGMRRWMRVLSLLGAAAIVSVIPSALVGGFATSASAASTTYAFHCQSANGSSATEYTVAGIATATVAPGHNFSLTNFVLTGTPDRPLLIKHMDVTIVVSAGADVTSLHEGVDGPGAQAPPGAPATPGTPNSTTPVSFVVRANGAPGTVIGFTLAAVSSTVVNPNDHTQTMKVDCTRVSGPTFASTRIASRGHGSGSSTTAPHSTTTRSTTTTSRATTTTAARTTTTTAPKHDECESATLDHEHCSNDRSAARPTTRSAIRQATLTSALIASREGLSAPSAMLVTVLVLMVATCAWVLRRNRAF